MYNFLKRGCAAVSLFVLVAGAAQAAPITVPLTSLGSTSTNYTGSFSSTKALSGNFVDQFLISFVGTALINSQLSASFNLANASNSQIVFNSVDLDGIAFALSVSSSTTSGVTTVVQRARLTSATDMNGFVLTVDGCAGACNGTQLLGTTINAVYSGTVNLTRVATVAPTAVPEPGSLALALAALGGAGWTARRRQAAVAA